MDSKSSAAYRSLRRRIFSGDLPPGERLSERALCDEIQLSRTPVREAILRLENEGLIQPDGSGGRVVRIWAPADVRARLDIRLAIEGLAVRYAVQRHNPDAFRGMILCCDRGEKLVDEQCYDESVMEDLNFHLALLKASGNDEIVRAGRLLPMSGTFLPGPDQDFDHDMREAFDEHRKVTELMANADADGACGLLTEHMRRGADRLIGWLEERIASGALAVDQVDF